YPITSEQHSDVLHDEVLRPSASECWREPSTGHCPFVFTFPVAVRSGIRMQPCAALGSIAIKEDLTKPKRPRIRSFISGSESCNVVRSSREVISLAGDSVMDTEGTPHQLASAVGNAV